MQHSRTSLSSSYIKPADLKSNTQHTKELDEVNSELELWMMMMMMKVIKFRKITINIIMGCKVW
ncbi:hypothetical protein DERF_013460 [Dermatophagoides farinae]|uniref:Uncharacterized protein n=1 Tax=Dermatophagoides farinae TaxID=6954 RepID=A0A922HMH3_DERFA|nr:hypothetical protein DERF_013460 [Dermatophagoides farinae]